MIELQDLDVIKQHLDSRYVLVDDCNDIQKDNVKKFSSDDKRLSNIENTLNGFKKIGWIVVGAVLSETAISLIELLKQI